MEDSLKNFISAVIFLVKLFTGLDDKFLAQKLYGKLSGLIEGYVKFLSSREDNKASMSHNVDRKDLINQVDNLLDFLDYLEHSELTAATPLLYSRRNLLVLKLDLIRLNKEIVNKQSDPKENITEHPAPNVSRVSRPKTQKADLSSNQEKILGYIKRSPNVRTKEIIEEFSILSKRTVKRNLKELIDGGLLQKRSKDKAVYYSVI